MYFFRKIDIDAVDKKDYYSNPNKVPSSHLEWLSFLENQKNVSPVILEVIGENGRRIGYFAGGIKKILGIRVLGSPFRGWMSQHMGFDLRDEVDKALLVDELIDFAIATFRVSCVQLTDYCIEDSDIKRCTHNLIRGKYYKTCYIDLSLSESELSRNLKSGYRTCIKKFYKEGGVIEEDYSDAFIEDHHRHLKQVFQRVGRNTPDYRNDMRYLYHTPNISKGINSEFGIYSIKAMIPLEENGVLKNKSIASSFFVHNGYMARFVSNASYTIFRKYCPNQALMWNAITAFKAAGLRYIDMGGEGNYKLNYSGGNWQLTPTIIYCTNKVVELLLIKPDTSRGIVNRIMAKVLKSISHT